MMFRRATSSSPAAANANYVNSATLPADLTCFLCKNIFKEVSENGQKWPNGFTF